MRTYSIPLSMDFSPDGNPGPVSMDAATHQVSRMGAGGAPQLLTNGSTPELWLEPPGKN